MPEIPVDPNTTNIFVEITDAATEVSAEIHDESPVIEVHVDSSGPQGLPGQGVPAGGTSGQVLKKASGTDYDTEWVDDLPLEKGTGNRSVQTQHDDDPTNACVASGSNSLALGARATASNLCSVAIGSYNRNIEDGAGPTCTGQQAIAFGVAAQATAHSAFAIGQQAKATAVGAFALGVNSEANAIAAYAIGGRVKANSAYQFVTGTRNIADDNDEFAFIVGNGSKVASVETFSNAMTLDWNGNEVIAGKMTVGAAPTADMDVATKKYVDDNSSVATASGAVAAFPDGAALPVKALTVDIEPVQSGTGDPAPDNVRPISGWSEAKVAMTGKNLFDIGTVSQWVTAAGDQTHNISISGSTITTLIRGSGGTVDYNTQKQKPGATVTISWTASKNYSRAFIRLRKKDDSGWMASGNATITGFSYNSFYKGWYKDAGSTTDAVFTATIPDCLYWNLGVGYNNNSVTTGDYETISNVQIEVGSTASAYEAYNGTVIPVTIPTPPGTVYGGTLDVLTGVLTVDREIRTYDGDEDWWTAANTTNRFGLSNTGGNSGIAADNLSNYLISTKWGNTAFTFGLRDTGTLYVCLDTTATQMTNTEFKNYLSSNPLTICCKVSPVTYQLTPQEVTTLLGANCIWADAGDVDVTYRADPTLRIEKVESTIQTAEGMIAGVESEMTATKNYSGGDLLVANNTLYKATSSIANGSAIVPGTNVTSTTVETEINNVKSGYIAKPSSPASGSFLVWNGSAWVAQTLSTWQASSY